MAQQSVFASACASSCCCVCPWLGKPANISSHLAYEWDNEQQQSNQAVISNIAQCCMFGREQLLLPGCVQLPAPFEITDRDNSEIVSAEHIVAPQPSQALHPCQLLASLRQQVARAAHKAAHGKVLQRCYKLIDSANRTLAFTSSSICIVFANVAYPRRPLKHTEHDA
jgi:hypothetical protein